MLEDINTHLQTHTQSESGSYINYGLAETRCKCHMKYEKDITMYSNRVDIKCWVQDTVADLELLKGRIHTVKSAREARENFKPRPL